MKLIYCTDCWPNRHHDESEHDEDPVVTVEQANFDVKVANRARRARNVRVSNDPKTAVQPQNRPPQPR